MAAEIDLFAVRRGSVTAPAGCGKTHLIAINLLEHDYAKPALILTHTVAGVVALRGRLQQLGVPSAAYRLMTLDGWAIRLATMFPARCAVLPEVLRITNARTDYKTIQPNSRKPVTSMISSPLAFRARLLMSIRIVPSHSTPWSIIHPAACRHASSVTRCRPYSASAGRFLTGIPTFSNISRARAS